MRMNLSNLDVDMPKHLYTNYKKWVINNPTKVSELETAVKWGSYLIAGRFQNASLFCEIIYSGSKIFEMFNDFLISGKLPQLTSGEFDRLKVLLTVLEYVAVLVEVTAVQIWGETGRWAVVAIIQLFKMIWRLILLFKHKVLLLGSPPIKQIDRMEVVKEITNVSNGFCHANDKRIIRLPRTGRLMRTLNGTAPSHSRNFSPITQSITDGVSHRRSLPMKLITAEVLNICRPMSHLSSMYLFGMKSWVPWCLAFGIDLTSLHLYNGSSLTKEEQFELGRRRLNLLFYLIRNPAFHAVTHRRINQFLIAAGDKIPLARFICQPLLEYIPEWQKLYSYTWS